MVQVGDVDANIASHLQMIQNASKQGAKLVVSSEAGLTGYDKRGTGVGAALHATDTRLNVFAKAAKRHNLCAILGLFLRENGTLFNASIAFMPDGSRLTQHKAVLTEQELAAGITPGPKSRTPVHFAGRKIAIVICADVAIPRLWPTLQKEDFDTVALCTAGLGDISAAVAPNPATPAKRAAYLKKAAAVGFPAEWLKVAMKHNLDFIASNQAAYQPDKGFFHIGHGAALSATGRVHAIIPGQFIGQHLRPELLVTVL
jgi:predicted amidohydrolase